VARTLVLMDESGDASKSTGDSATLSDNGLVSYQGTGVRAIIGKWLAVDSPQNVFDNMRGWSNGYVSLQERK